VLEELQFDELQYFLFLPDQNNANSYDRQANPRFPGRDFLHKPIAHPYRDQHFDTFGDDEEDAQLIDDFHTELYSISNA
jgi:hypothetical protein